MNQRGFEYTGNAGLKISTDYVDCFGRIILAVKGDDGDIYISLNELKKSGFELFKAGCFPRRDSKLAPDHILISQFELYMKMKAAKFMSKHELIIPELKVNKIIEEEKNNYIDLNQDRVVQKNNRRSLTITTNVQTPKNRITSPNKSQKSSGNNHFYNNYKHQENHNNSFSGISNNYNKGGTAQLRRPASDSFAALGNALPKLDIEQKQITRLSLSLNMTHQVTVIHVESPKVGWVNLSSNYDIIQSLVANTNKDCMMAPYIIPVRNQMCAALSGQAWYRAVCLETNPIKVQYLENGNENDQHLTELKELPLYLQEIPAQGIKISLDPNSTDKLKPHTKITIRPIKQDQDETYLVQIVPEPVSQETSPLRKPTNCKPKSNTSSPKPAISSPQSTNLSPKPFNSSPNSSANLSNFLAKSPTPSRPSSISSQELKPSESFVETKQPKFKNKTNLFEDTPPNSLAKATPVRKGTKQLQRKLLVESKCNTGLFQCTSKVDDKTIVGFTFSEEFMTEICLLDEIMTLTEDDPTYKPNVGDMVAVFTQDNYVRGIVTSFLFPNYTCALIDYGTIVKTDKIRRLDEKFKTVPEFACECIADADTINKIASLKDTDLMYEIKIPNLITLKHGDDNYVLQGRPWNVITATTLQQEQIVYKNKPKNRTVKLNDIVIIVTEKNGNLFIRTRELNALLKKITQSLEDYKAEPFKKNPEVGYLTLCPYTDNNLYRAVIKSISSTEAIVEYIDYGDSGTVPLNKLKNISQDLADLDYSTIQISLKGFVGATYTPKALQLLANYSAKKDKFSVNSIENGNVCDLITSEKISLSQVLKDIDKPKPASSMPNIKLVKKPPATPAEESSPMLNDLVVTKLGKGIISAMCVFTGDLIDGTVTVCATDSDTMNILLEIGLKVTDYAEKNTTPHNPEVYEICIAQFEDEWYRAAVMEKSGNSYEVFFVDYGNSSTVTSKNIRKMPRELLKYESLGVLCIIKGALKGDDKEVQEPLLTRLRSEIQENQVYNIEICEEKEQFYIITFPELFKTLKEEGLL